MKTGLITLKSDFQAVTDVWRENSFLIYYKDTIIARLYKKGEQWFVWVEYLKTRLRVGSATEGIEKICEVAQCEKFLLKRDNKLLNI
jgi:hypothetical protein